MAGHGRRGCPGLLQTLPCPGAHGGSAVYPPAVGPSAPKLLLWGPSSLGLQCSSQLESTGSTGLGLSPAPRAEPRGQNQTALPCCAQGWRGSTLGGSRHWAGAIWSLEGVNRGVGRAGQLPACSATRLAAEFGCGAVLEPALSTYLCPAAAGDWPGGEPHCHLPGGAQPCPPAAPGLHLLPRGSSCGQASVREEEHGAPVSPAAASPGPGESRETETTVLSQPRVLPHTVAGGERGTSSPIAALAPGALGRSVLEAALPSAAVSTC